MTCSLYLPKNRRSFDDKLQRSIAERCTQAERWLQIFNEKRTFSLSFKMAPLSLGKKMSKTGRRPWAPGRKIDRPPARPEQKNEKDAHPPIGRVSQRGRVGARPALSEVLAVTNTGELYSNGSAAAAFSSVAESAQTLSHKSSVGPVTVFFCCTPPSTNLENAIWVT